MKAWQSFVFRWCSGWVELEGKAERKKGGWVFFFFLLPLNSLWLCQSVLKQPFSFLADSSTIPSEMLIWQLSAPSSAFPSLTSLYLRDEIALARPFFVPMSPLLKVHTQKQSLNSDLFRISTNVGEGQRLCKIVHLPWQKKTNKNIQLHAIEHYILSQFANAVTFLCAELKRANFWNLYLLCVWMKAIISAVSPNIFWQFFQCTWIPRVPARIWERHECFHSLSTRCQILPDADACQLLRPPDRHVYLFIQEI